MLPKRDSLGGVLGIKPRRGLQRITSINYLEGIWFFARLCDITWTFNKFTEEVTCQIRLSSTKKSIELGALTS